MSQKRKHLKEEAKTWLRNHFAEKLFKKPYAVLESYLQKSVDLHIQAKAAALHQRHEDRAKDTFLKGIEFGKLRSSS